ncbi:MAG: dihydroorotate dehydrogenase-like protein [Planctomycetota bacterium]
MPDLATDYMGLRLRSPLVASSSPITAELGSLRQLEEAGAAAVVLPSLFEEQISFEVMEIDRLLETGAESFGEATTYFPELDTYNTGPDQYLELIAKAKEILDIPVIASLNGVSSGGWLEYATLIEQAGADALEINPYLVVADPDTTSSEVEASDRELVATLRRSVGIPLAVKLSPYFTALAHTASELVDAGARGLTLFNRLYKPDLDIDRLEVVQRLRLSTSEELRLPLLWVAILHGRIQASLAASTGIHTVEDVVKVLLAGADVAMLASALLQQGPEHLGRLEKGLLEWLTEREYESVAQMRGSVSQRAVADPTAFERATYMKALRSYSSDHAI